MKGIVKENNGGGVSIEVYEDNNTIESVVCGMDYCNDNGLSDLIGLVDGEWIYTDASIWFDRAGNSEGDTNEDGKELTALDVVDDAESTRIIATYDGSVCQIFPHEMGHAGKRLFFGLRK